MGPDDGILDGLARYRDRVGFYANLSKRGVRPGYLIIGLPLMTLGLGTLSSEFGYSNVLTEFPYNIVFAVDVMLLLLVVYLGETRYIGVLEEIRDVFEVPNDEYHAFFRRMSEVMYLSSPFAPTDRRDPAYLANRLLFVGVLGLMGATVIAVGVHPVTLTPTLKTAMYGLYLLLILGLATTAVYFGLWYGMTFCYFMGYRIAEFDVRLDATQSPNNLGFAPYGRFIVRMSFCVFLGVVITGWTGFVEPNVFSFVLTAAGSLVLPAAFVGSQYGMHVAIMRAKQDRLKDIRAAYADDIDEWFSPRPTERSEDDLTKQLRINSMLALKDEIRGLPEWPTNANQFKQVGVATVLPNVPTILSVVGIPF